jgi:hypothetical protein
MNLRIMRGIGIVMALGVGPMGCSGEEVGPLPGSQGTEGSAMTSGTAGHLSVLETTHDRLNGTLARDQQKISFEVERSPTGHRATFTGSSGKLLLRATIGQATEKVAVGGAITIEGPRGTVFGTAEPDLAKLTVSGDISTISSVLLDPDFSLIQALPAALSQRRDIDLSILPALPALAPPAHGSGTLSSNGAPLDPSLLESHDDGGCAVCHVGCSAAVAACLAAVWGPWAPLICVPPGIVCHIGCANSACQ